MRNLSQLPDTPQPSNLPTLLNSRRGYIGAGLVIIGLLLLIGTMLQSEVLGLLILPAMGIMFLYAGIITRAFGFFIPGGILTGLGVAVFAQEQFMGSASSDARGGIIVVGLALGFLVILPLCWYFTAQMFLWPLIPGAFLLFVGICLCIGGAAIQFLEFAGTYFWPAVLVGVGAYLLFRARPPAQHPRRPARHVGA